MGKLFRSITAAFGRQVPQIETARASTSAEEELRQWVLEELRAHPLQYL